MAASDSAGDDSLYPIAVLIDELKNEDVQVSGGRYQWGGGRENWGWNSYEMVASPRVQQLNFL